MHASQPRVHHLIDNWMTSNLFAFFCSSAFLFFFQLNNPHFPPYDKLIDMGRPSSSSLMCMKHIIISSLLILATASKSHNNENEKNNRNCVDQYSLNSKRNEAKIAGIWLFISYSLVCRLLWHLFSVTNKGIFFCIIYLIKKKM